MKLLRHSVDGLDRLVPEADSGRGLGLESPLPFERIAVELPGALLEWPLTASTGDLPTITVRDATEADWFWHLFGEGAHLALLDGAREIAVRVDTARLTKLHRLARALWARAWWPASERTGLAALDAVTHDAEIIALIAELDDLAAGELDGDLELSAAAHPRLAFAALQHSGTAEVRALAAVVYDWCGWGEVPVVAPEPARADYALAAGGEHAGAEEPVASGTAPLRWQSVPAGVFDAGARPVHWAVDARPEPVMHVRVDLLPGGPERVDQSQDDRLQGDRLQGDRKQRDQLQAGSKASARGIAVAVSLGPDPEAGAVTGELAEDGSARIALPLSAAELWAHDWDSVTVQIGVPSGLAEAAGTGDVASATEDEAARDRVRAYASTRLHVDDELTLHAERLAAEDDF